METRTRSDDWFIFIGLIGVAAGAPDALGPALGEIVQKLAYFFAGATWWSIVRAPRQRQIR